MIPKVVDNPIDLFDHGLGQHLYFHSNLDCSDRAARYQISSIQDCLFSWDDLAESAVTTASFHTLALVLHIQHALSQPYAFGQCFGTVNGQEVFVQLHGY